VVESQPISRSVGVIIDPGIQIEIGRLHGPR
jgi:hypothetical protein